MQLLFPNACFFAFFSLVLSACGDNQPDTRSADGRADGAKVYGVYCVGCHGPDGRRGAGSMRLVDGQRDPEAEIRQVVENGRNEMPGWKQRLKADEIQAVVAYTMQLEPAPAARKQD